MAKQLVAMKVLFIFMISVFSLVANTNEKTLTILQDKPDHSEWGILLKKYVNNNGDVNYKAFMKDKNALDTYINILSANSPTAKWSKNEKLAYYINLYNAATVKLILDNYPLKSIKDIKNPWDNSWIKIGNDTYSLGDIEHKILRKMDEPRIHFAINCASYSCPKLANIPFLASTLELQLKKATFDFVNDPSKNKITSEKLELSNIFKWFKGDFTNNGSLIDFLQPYTKLAINPKAKINYTDYDWSLNGTK